MSRPGSMSILIFCTSLSTQIMIINPLVEDIRIGFNSCISWTVCVVFCWFVFWLWVFAVCVCVFFKRMIQIYNNNKKLLHLLDWSWIILWLLQAFCGFLKEWLMLGICSFLCSPPPLFFKKYKYEERKCISGSASEMKMFLIQHLSRPQELENSSLCVCRH